MTTAYATDARFTEHNLRWHPEHAGRIKAVWRALDAAGLTERLSSVEATPASDQQALAVHSANHLNRLTAISQQSKTVLIDQDTYALPLSLDIARLAAGGLMNVIDAVAAAKADNGLAVIRPPGHHATADRQMGFCLLNSIAIGARHAQRQHKLKKILILDYDVHHGNGTQDIFGADPSVMFISIHQSPHYPGTGKSDEIGQLDGRGFTLNAPVAAGHGDQSYQALFEELVWPAAERFHPELMLVSAGFDAHWADPLGQMQLSLRGYDYMARESIKMAQTLCGGKIAFAMEGGYDLKALAHGWRNIASALLGADELSDPYGPPTSSASVDQIRPLIKKLRRLHGL